MRRATRTFCLQEVQKMKNPFKEEPDMGDTSSKHQQPQLWHQQHQKCNCGTSSIGASSTITSFLFYPSWKGVT
ncbi:hypothetical protein GJAV_G00058610 [Gymnothorax javanicus]|nr:hypothetical protein GJAV_G00058610 [Gymnothorax javanicus]